MLSMDMVVGAAQVIMSDKIPVVTVSAFVFNPHASLVAISARENVTTHFCWVESNMTKLKLHSSVAAVIPTLSGQGACISQH